MKVNKKDRCDKCGAQAIYRYARPGSDELDLLFCNHHSGKFVESLTAQGFVIIDSSELVDA